MQDAAKRGCLAVGGDSARICCPGKRKPKKGGFWKDTHEAYVMGFAFVLSGSDTVLPRVSKWNEFRCTESRSVGWSRVESARYSYLVDPASSHMLVSKIKPCMSKYKHLYCETANGSLNQLSFI